MANSTLENERVFAKNIVIQVAYLDLDVLRQLHKEAAESMSMWHSAGAILDPTRYRDTLHDGSIDHAKAQHEIMGHLIAIRELIDKMQGASEQYKRLHGDAE